MDEELPPLDILAERRTSDTIKGAIAVPDSYLPDDYTLKSQALTAAAATAPASPEALVTAAERVLAWLKGETPPDRPTGLDPEPVV